jgi:maleate isomerase
MITVGLLTPHAAAGADAEFEDMVGHGVRTRVVRVRPSTEGDAEAPTSVDGLRGLARLDLLDAAVARLEPESLDALAYASTSTAYAIGAPAERELVARLQDRWSLPVSSTPVAAVDALRRWGVQRLSLVNPPWFGADRSALGAAYFGEQGFTVVQANLADVPDDPALVEPHHVVDWASSHVDADVDAVFLGGNGFRAAGAVEALEGRLGCLVLESNQVLLWSALGQIGTSLEILDAGSLLRTLTSSDPTGRGWPTQQREEHAHVPGVLDHGDVFGRLHYRPPRRRRQPSRHQRDAAHGLARRWQG